MKDWGVALESLGTAKQRTSRCPADGLTHRRVTTSFRRRHRRHQSFPPLRPLQLFQPVHFVQPVYYPRLLEGARDWCFLAAHGLAVTATTLLISFGATFQVVVGTLSSVAQVS